MHQPSRFDRLTPLPIKLYLEAAEVERLRQIVTHDRYGTLDEVVSLMVRVMLAHTEKRVAASLAELDLRTRLVDAQLKEER